MTLRVDAGIYAWLSTMDISIILNQLPARYPPGPLSVQGLWFVVDGLGCRVLG